MKAEHTLPDRDTTDSVPKKETGPIVDALNHVSFLGVQVEKGKGGSRVPNKDRFADDAITEFDMRLMKDIAVALSLNQPVVIQGGSGIGKSHTIDRMCSMLNMESYYVNCHKFDSDVLIGKMTVVEGTQTGYGWQDGIVIQAARNGGVLFLDEYNFMRGDTRAVLHQVLDAVLSGKKISLADNKGEEIEVHKDFRIVVAQNAPGGQHGDREILDPAQYTRFAHVVFPEDLPKETKRARLMGRFGKKKDVSIDTKEYLYPGNVDSAFLAEIPGFEELMDKYLEFTESAQRMVESGALGRDAQSKQPVYFSFQRDADRVMSFVEHFYNGDIGETLRTALRYYFVKRFESPEDQRKVEEMILASIKYVPPVESRRREPPVLAKKDTKAVPSATASRKLPTIETVPGVTEYISDEKAVQEIRKLYDAGAPKNMIARSLAGIDTPEAWMLRDELLEAGADQADVARGLAGLDSPGAWKMREKLTSVASLDGVMESLAGVNSARGGFFRARLKASSVSKKSTMIGITGVDTVETEDVRVAAIRDRDLLDEVAASYAGIDTDYSWNAREQLIREGALDGVAKSLIGLDSERAWKMRELLLSKGASKESIALGLAGVGSERAWKLREKYYKSHVDKAIIAMSLAGLDSPLADEWRKKLEEDKVGRGTLALSISGDRLTFAWRLLKGKKEHVETAEAPVITPSSAEIDKIAEEAGRVATRDLRGHR